MATTITLQDRLTRIWEDPPGLYGWLATTDHKKIGKRYLATAMIFLIIGGIEALLIRTQLIVPNADLLSAEAYNQIMTMHGTTMIFWYALPILTGFSVYLMPMMIGARDLAFPRLNALTYWTFLLSGVLLYISPFMGEAPRGGWFAYVPLTNYEFSPGIGMDFFATSLLLFIISSTGGAINFIATIFRLRAPGMSLARMPLMMWSTTTISWVSIFGLPPLALAVTFLELNRLWKFPFYETGAMGDPLLWQQLFWIFGHPWVYMIFLPATGMISMIIPVFSRRPIVGYVWVATSTVLTGLVGFGVWVHHMFTTGMPQMSMSFFSAASMTISLFTIIQIFAWLATIWLGKPVLKTPMLFSLGFILLIIIGGLSGVMTAVIPFDWQLHDTYFVVAHIHFVLIGANVFPVFAGLYYWLPKMTGRMMNETLGKWNFWLMLIGMLGGLFVMHISGMLGMPRRIYTYPVDAGWTLANLWTSIGAYILAAGALVGVFNFVYSFFRGERAAPNPWGADSLEWDSPSPPPPYGVARIPTVASRHPLWDPHHESDDLDNSRVLDHGEQTLATSTLDAKDGWVANFPGETALPLVLSFWLFGAFLAMTFEALWVTAGFVVLGLATAAWWMWPTIEEEETA